MDGVDADVTEEWLANIDKALSDAGKSAIDYLVVQHMEPDHSGAILDLVKKFPEYEDIHKCRCGQHDKAVL